MYKELSRRQFIKVGAISTILVGAGTTGMLSIDSWLKEANADESVEERVAYTYHQSHCMGCCPLKCTVRDERLVLIEPNEAGNVPAYSACCLKGISEVQHVYSADRIQTPLKRVGNRGSGEFIAISWDEALDTVASTIKEIQTQYGEGSILFKSSGEGGMSFLPSLLKAQSGNINGIDVGLGNGRDPAFGNGFVYCVAGTDARDWVNAKNLLVIGTNWLESNLMQSEQFFDAKEAGCNIVDIDPHFTTTAGKSNRWVPIKPGTDAALFLGMISVILDNQWQDETFMKMNTSMPFLVSTDDGTLLCANGEAVANANPFGDPVIPEYKVWDKQLGQAIDYFLILPESLDDIALEGQFQVDGKNYTTAYAQLKKNQSVYSKDWASEKTGISPDVIEELARLFAVDKPSSIATGWGGSDKWANADVAGHALAVLAAITGNSGVPGGDVGIFSPFGYPPLGSWMLPEEYQASPPEMALYDLRTKPNSVKSLFAVGDVALSQWANKKLTAQWLDTLEFIVGADIYLTDTMQYCDIVLPVCTKFECEELIGGIASANSRLMLREKIIEPLFESHTDSWIEYAIAEKLGLAKHLPKSSTENVKYQLETSLDPSIASETIESFQAKQSCIILPSSKGPEITFGSQFYFTPSGKIEAYYDSLVQDRQQFPNYEDPHEAYDDNPLREQYPLQLNQQRTKYHIHVQFYDATWIQQFQIPSVELNPTDMQSRALVDGEKVEVVNDRGSFGCIALGNAAIRPGSIRMLEGAWSKFMDFGNYQDCTNDYALPRGIRLMQGPVMPVNDTLVEVRKANNSGGDAK